MSRSIVRSLNIILAGILAGVSFGIWIGFNPKALSPATYVAQQQNMLLNLRVLMTVLVIAVTVITLASAYLQRRTRSISVALLAAAGFFIACILITLFGNKPIDDAVLTWHTASLPDNWTDLRDTWCTLHMLRTLVELAGLLIVTWTGIRKD